ncbi:hypothetical protein ASZ90_004135 [hydrocarbon metagenome]|uniref:MraZ domain-containing protein n=1 Tax=hydrocarbon metagenome TaxID=938273 RepID=A0A0W8FYQ9_9ZZZZ
MITNLDKFGRVIIPKKLREDLGISTETTLNISEDDKKNIHRVSQRNNAGCQ